MPIFDIKYAANNNKKFDFNKLKLDFYNYLQENGKNTDVNLLSSDISIFMFSSEFSDFLQDSGSQYNLPQEISSITDLEKLQYDEENQEFLTDDEDENSGSLLFAGILNDLIKDDKVKSSIDKDSDGKLSEEEMTNFLDAMKSLDENADNLSLEDIFGTYNNSVNPAENPEAAPEDTTPVEYGQESQKTEETEQNKETQNTSAPQTTGNNSGGSTYNPSNYQNTDTNTNTEKTLDNMSKDELKSELSKANTDLSTNQNKLNSILDGSDSTLQTLQGDIDKLYETYQTKLEEVDKDLAEEVNKTETDIAKKEDDINKKDVEISNKNNDISAAEVSLASAKSERESYEASLSALESTDTSKMDEAKKSAISNQINELRNTKIPEAKEKEEKAQEKLNNEKAELVKLQDEKTGYEGELDELNKQKEALDERVIKEHPEIEDDLKAYNDAKNKYTEIKATETSKAKETVSASQDRIKEVQAALDKVENKELNKDYKTSGLESTYNLNDVNYNIVGMEGFNNLEEFQQYILSKGMTNKGLGGNDWPMQCHNFSNEYGDIMLGTSKIDINSSDAAAQAAKGKDRQFQNVYCDSYNTAFEVIAAELEAGRPVVAKIRTPGVDMNHYGLICGIREGADRNNLQQSDFLYIDSYGGNIGSLGKTRELTGYKNSVHVWQSQDYNFEYKYQNTYAKKYMTAEEVRRSYSLA